MCLWIFCVEVYKNLSTLLWISLLDSSGVCACVKQCLSVVHFKSESENWFSRTKDNSHVILTLYIHENQCNLVYIVENLVGRTPN